MIAENRKRHEQAKEQGRACRRSGGKRESNPYRRSPSLRDLANEWEAGFIEEDAARKVHR